MPDLVLPLEQLSHAPLELVGHQAKQLGELDQLGANVLSGFVIPTSTLAVIADHNRLLALGQTRQAIRGAELPSEVGLAILRAYHQVCYQGHAAVTLSFLQPHQPLSTRGNIHGDANLIETILESWANSLNLESTKDLIPAAIIVQCQPQPQSSGQVYNFDPTTGRTDVITISAVRGVYDPDHHRDQDVTQLRLSRTSHTPVHHRPGRQRLQLSRALDSYHRQELDKHQPINTMLTLRDITKLASIIDQLNHHPSLICLDWNMVDGQVLFSHWSTQPAKHITHPSVGPDVTEGQVQEAAPTMLTQLYHHTCDLARSGWSSNGYTVSGSSASHNSNTSADGVFFDSSELVQMAGIHPEYLGRTSAGQDVLHHLRQHLITYWPPTSPLWYLPFSPGPAVLRELDFGPELESGQTSSALGLRGAERIAAHPEWFELELTAIQEAASVTGGELRLVIPGVNQAQDLRTCWQILERMELPSPSIHVWAQLSSPHMALHSGAVERLPLSGVVLDADRIFSLSIGRPAEVVGDREPDFTAAMTEYLEQVARTLAVRQATRPAATVPVVLQLSQHHPRLIAAAARLGIQGVVLPSQPALALARQVLFESTVFAK